LTAGSIFEFLTLPLANTALESGEEQAEAFEESVQLMTIHSAKGLEFPLVFIAGVEEGLFPHHMSKDDPNRLQEERRLCYVGITRAMEKLFISYAEKRNLHGNETYNKPSRFIKELPAELLQEIRFKAKFKHPQLATQYANKFRTLAPIPSKVMTRQELGDTGYRIGQRVKHPVFGEGTVLNYEGQGTHARVQVNFKEAGSKWLVLAYAKLEVV